MTIEIINCEQGSPEWFAARLGLPTASMFQAILAAAKDGKERKTRNTYIRKLAGELVTGDPMENYQNADMERGKAMEAEARNNYAFECDADPQLIGFIRNGAKGCSPDSLIGENGILEIKTNAPHILIERILSDEFPAEYLAQCQGNLWVAEREWIDLCCYWPKMPPFIKRMSRDDTYIAKLEKEVGSFNTELAELVDKIKRYERPQNNLMAG